MASVTDSPASPSDAHGTYIVNAAASVRDGGVRVALGCVAATPVRATAVEERLCGRRALGGGGARGRRGSRRLARPALRRPCVGRLPAAPRRGRGSAGSAASGRESQGLSVAQPTTSRTISVEVNGELYEREVPTRRLLVHFLRDDLELTGTHIGCDTGNCGACTIHLDGQAVKSCMLLAVQADGTKLRTVEGLAQDGELTRAAAVVLRAPRAPVRLLHAGDADERLRAARARTRTRARRTSSSRSRATSAGARGT